MVEASKKSTELNVEVQSAMKNKNMVLKARVKVTISLKSITMLMSQAMDATVPVDYHFNYINYAIFMQIQ